MRFPRSTRSNGKTLGYAPRRHRGPIVAVFDTPSWMHGVPETVTKALVLEALSTAHAERRRCYAYTFSGPGQTAEQELDLPTEGIGRLLDFLGMSFHGGTDPREVVKLVVKLYWRTVECPPKCHVQSHRRSPKRGRTDSDSINAGCAQSVQCGSVRAGW